MTDHHQQRGFAELTGGSMAPPERVSDVGIMGEVLADDFADGEHLRFVDGGFRRFHVGCWRDLSEDELGGIVMRRLRAVSPHPGHRVRAKVKEIVALLKMSRATAPDQSRLADPLWVVNVANGELWISPDGTVDLRPHSPASNLLYCLDVTYDPAATCPRYDRALAEIFSHSTSPGSLVAFWHEFVAHVLHPGPREARIFIGSGGGNDGKTTLTGLLTRLIGRQRVAAVQVGQLASNHFMLGHLAEKWALIDDDVAVGAVLPDGLLKSISEPKVVTGEAKHRDPFEFVVRAVPLLLTNTVPRLRDASHGFRRRLVVIPFERRFGRDEVDIGQFPTIQATEMSGVLNRALEGLRRLAQRGWKFDPPEAITAATEAWWAKATGLESGIKASDQLDRSNVGTGGFASARAMESTADRQAKNHVSAAPARGGMTVHVAISASDGTCNVKVQADTPTEITVRVCARCDAATIMSGEPRS